MSTRARQPGAAEQVNADVVIVGAGIVGGLMACRLRAAGLSVVMLDAGPALRRSDAVQRFHDQPWGGINSPYPEAPWAPVPSDDAPWRFYGQYIPKGTSPKEQLAFQGLYLRQLGGTSWHFTGHAERFYPNDFNLHREYGHGVDWPIGYSDLEPWYTEVEREWGVAGDQSCLGTRPDHYPMPVVPTSYLDRCVAAAAEALDSKWRVGPLPHARNSKPNYDHRPQCCGNASCRYICPIGAKYDGSVHVAKAERAGARVMPDRVAYEVVVGGTGQVERVRYLRADRGQGEATGKVFILACHAIEAAKLLLMSNAANSSGRVGQYLMTIVDVDTKGYAPKPVWPFRGPVFATGGIDGFRDGDFRRQYAAATTFICNGGFDKMLRGPTIEVQSGLARGLIGVDLRDWVHDRAARQVHLSSSVEVLPIRENCVKVDWLRRDPVLGIPLPKVDFRIDQYTLDGCAEVARRDFKVLDRMGATEITQTDPANPEADYAIIGGTARMGTDPATSVVDGVCRSHDHKNLYVVGTSAYPTIGICSPSLTAAALALRAADNIVNSRIAG